MLPDPTLDEQNILADSSYYEEINQHELSRVEANWGEENEIASDEEIDYDNDFIGDGDDDDDVIRSDDDDE